MNASLGLPPAVAALVDQVIQGVRVAFPARVLARYLCGSYATGTATTSSDVDISVVFVDHFSPEERRRLADIAAVIADRGAVRGDLAAVAERFVCTAALPSTRVAADLRYRPGRSYPDRAGRGHRAADDARPSTTSGCCATRPPASSRRWTTRC